MENAVMRNFAKIVNTRCMEKLFLEADYKDKTKAGLEWSSWWVYSKNLVMADKGKYYLVTWLSDRTDRSVPVTGKYEITLAPWIWYKYADATTTAAAHSQHVSCTCASNSIAFSEQHIQRIGSPPADVFSEE